jgi:hypothetical protein
MYQNRVNPFGAIIKTPARGSLMGNRGVIHSDAGEIKKAYKLKTWITCLLRFKGRKFRIMAPKRWTALFFLDEATAFAAGHRPCNECRRDDFKRFKLFWIKGNSEYGFNMKTKIALIDEILHKERINSKGEKITFEMNISEIPDGTFVTMNSIPYLFFHSRLYEWTPDGYKNALLLHTVPRLTVITPKSIVKMFLAGYEVSSMVSSVNNTPSS